MTARRTLLTLRALSVGLLVLALVRVSFFTVYRVAGTSMVATLDDGDRIVVVDRTPLFSELTHGETVVLEVDDEVLVKRIMALPGDTIGMVMGNVVRNGHVLVEDIPSDRRRQFSMVDYTLGDDEVFVLGDHRRVSVDSRDFGPVGSRQILGRVLLRLSHGGLSTLHSLSVSSTR